MASNEQQIPILSTKLYRPPITVDYVLRDELEARLDAGVDLPLTVVSAPAGYGKSTLVSHWLENRNFRSAWLSLDVSDSDVRVFLGYFVASIRTVSAESCQKMLDILSAESLPPESIVASYLSNDLDILEERMILVLDDYHHIRTANIHSLLDRLLEHPPRGLHLVIVSRHDPSLSLTTLRARNLLAEFRMRDLQFSIDETFSLLRQVVNHSIPQGVINRLQDSTEGWPVGIRLAALALQHQDDDEAFLDRFGANTRPLQQYLIQEVLAGQPPFTRTRLLQTSILDRFNASLCEAIWGGGSETDGNPTNGKVFIEALETAGLFCVALDGNHDWFRFHHLFRDLLQQQLEESGDIEEISILHLRASRWFEDCGYYEEAIRHSLAGGDVNRAARIVGNARHELMNRDQWHRLERWLNLFPENIVEEQPQLMMLRCWLDANLWYRLDLLVRDLGLVDAMLVKFESDDVVPLKTEQSALRSGLAYWTLNLKDSVVKARQSMRDSPRGQECVQSTALLMQGAALQASDKLEEAENLLLDHMGKGKFSSPGSRARLLQSLCFIYWPEADPKKLHRSAARLLKFSQDHSLTWSMSFSRYFLGLNHYDCNELDEAAAQFEIIVDDPYRYPMQNVTHCSFLLSLTYQAQGLQDRALEVAENIMNFVFEHENRMFIDLAGAFKAELDLRQGRTVQANRWAKDFTSPPPHVMHRYFNTELTAFRILMAQDTSESRRAAAEGLESIHQILSRSHHKRLMMDVLGLKALLADAGGDSDTAVALLEEAVYLGQPGQLIRPLADLGPGIFSLLNRLNLDQEGLQYLGMIVSALRSSSGESIDSSRCPPLPETLSQRELEILGLFARELSNKEIAGRLFISTGTVKRHAHNIYSKLSVTTRRDAVSKAMRLGILVID